MFKMTVAPWRDASPYLGVGTYYRVRDAETDAESKSLVDVTLEAPLILNERQVRMLVQKYGTNSPDRMTQLSGAWTLRREIVQMGHDGIIAIGSKPKVAMERCHLRSTYCGPTPPFSSRGFSPKPRSPTSRDVTRTMTR